MRMLIRGFTEEGEMVFSLTHYNISTKQLPLLIANGSCTEGEVVDRPEVTKVDITIFFKP